MRYIILFLLILVGVGRGDGIVNSQNIIDPTSDLYFYKVYYPRIVQKGKNITITAVIKNAKANYNGKVTLTLDVYGKNTQYHFQKQFFNLQGANKERKVVRFTFGPLKKASYKAILKLNTQGLEVKKNNKKEFSFNVVNRSDLIVCIKAPLQVNYLQKKGIYFKVKNISDYPSRATALRTYIQGNGVKYHSVPSLRQNQEFVIKRNARFKRLGKVRIKAIIDPNNRVVEENENNNEKEIKIKVISPTTFDPSGLSTFECSN